MIELNLLPKELRVARKKINMPEIPILPVASCVLALVMLLHVSALLATKFKLGTMRRVEIKWKEMQPAKTDAEKLSDEIDGLERRLKVTRDIATPPIDWAELLSGLNQAMIPNVWLSEFKPVLQSVKGSGKKQSGITSKLELSGYALGKEAATSIVGKFIDSLKQNEDFSKYFKEIELSGIRNQKFEGEEVMSFKLICVFKDPEPDKIKPAVVKKR